MRRAERAADDPRRDLAARFDRVRGDDVDAAVAAARDLLTDSKWTGALLAPLIAAQRGDPLFEPPLRIHRDAMRIGAVLFEHRVATVTAGVMSADALTAAPPPTRVVVPGRVSVVRFHRAAGATWRRWYAGLPELPFAAARAMPCVPRGVERLSDGEVRVCDGRREGWIVTAAPRDVVTITVQLRVGAAAVMREYAASDGGFRRAATLDEAASRTHMLLTLLRVSQRADAAPWFEAATHDPGFDLRWAAMREWLALDAAAAMPRLEAMAAHDRHAEVRAAARATVPHARALLCRG